MRIIGLAKILAILPDEGARTIVYLASSPDVAEINGEYFYKCRRAEPARLGRDDALARMLWEKSVALTGVDWPWP